MISVLGRPSVKPVLKVLSPMRGSGGAEIAGSAFASGITALMQRVGFLVSSSLLFHVKGGWQYCPENSDIPCSDSNQQCGDDFQEGPQYHFRDRSCGLNDPNGPFYDVQQGLYHLFYQDHIGLSVPDSYPQGFEGPSWGHGVSPDMVHWTHHPVALWNADDWYDIHALFTGSATVVDGKPVLMFPGQPPFFISKSSTVYVTPTFPSLGVCDMFPASGEVPGCAYGYTFGVASPTNSSDPFLTNWSKSVLNPVVNDTFDDPSTAWLTSSGELRWIANCGDGTVGDCGSNGSQAPLYGASDASFADAQRIGLTNLEPGECPSLFALPPLSPGTKPASNMPTHVHKWGCEPYKDCIELGTWHEGSPGEVGWWERHNATLTPTIIDQGAAYACKDLWDQNRRINIAWARLEPDNQGSQINGDVQTLAREVTYHPDLQQLLFTPLAEQATLRQGVLGKAEQETITSEASLVLGPWPHGNQSDIVIHVSIPTEEATLRISIDAEARIEFYVKFNGASSDREIPTSFEEVEVGMLTEEPFENITDTLRLLNDDKVLELRLLLDHTITEAYWQGGRVAMTAASPLTNSTSLSIFTDTADISLEVLNVYAWEMGSAWISNEDALRRRGR